MKHKIVYKKIDEVIPSEYNPRKLDEKDEKDLTQSVEEFGLVQPVIVNTHPDRLGVVIGGHQRLKIAKKLGIQEVPCVEVSLTLERERELNIRLNKNNGKFDYDLLQEHFDVEDLVDWGFEEFEFDVPDDVDYSSLDDEDLGEEIDDLEVNVRKAIQIEFEAPDYEPAKQLVAYFRQKKVYVGGLLIKLLEAEKQRLDESK